MGVAARAATPAPWPHCGGHRTAQCRPARRPGGTAGPPCPAGRGVGQSRGLPAARPATRRWHARLVGEAVACFEQALVAVEHLPEGRARQEQAIDVRFGLRHALGQRLENDRISRICARREGLAQALGDQHRLAGVPPCDRLFWGHRRPATRRRGWPARPRPGRDPGGYGTPGRDAPLPGPGVL